MCHISAILLPTNWMFHNLNKSLARGHESPWTMWRCLNRLRTGYTCSKEQRKKWQYWDGDTTCECGLTTENPAHMLQCIRLGQPCTLDDLSKFNDTAKSCVERWETTVWWHDDDHTYKLFKWKTIKKYSKNYVIPHNTLEGSCGIINQNQSETKTHVVYFKKWYIIQ